MDSSGLVIWVDSESTEIACGDKYIKQKTRFMFCQHFIFSKTFSFSNREGTFVPMLSVVGLVFVTCKNQEIGVALLIIGNAFM